MLNDSFERKIAELRDQMGGPKTDDMGFDILPFNVYGWRHDESTKQWICYKGGHAVAAILDSQLFKINMDRINKALVAKGAVPLPEGAFLQ